MLILLEIGLTVSVSLYVDIFTATETKIKESFPIAQFAINGFYKLLQTKVGLN